jgi:hypothetical protein
MATYYISKIDPEYDNVYIILYENDKILLGETYKGFGNLGGRIEKKDKTPLHSGIRELLEELFDWQDFLDRPRKQITNKLVNTIVEKFISNQQVIVYKQKRNIFILMSTEVLNQILSFVQTYPNLQSVYYPTMPQNVNELIKNRFPRLRGFDYSGIHSTYYNSIKEMFKKMNPNKSIEDHLKRISTNLGKKSMKGIRGNIKKVKNIEVYYKPESVLLAMYNTQTYDFVKLKRFLDKNILDPTLPMEIRSLAWVDLTRTIKEEDTRLIQTYGIGLASYISQDIELYNMIMNDQAELLINPEKDGMIFVLS